MKSRENFVFRFKIILLREYLIKNEFEKENELKNERGLNFFNCTRAYYLLKNKFILKIEFQMPLLSQLIRVFVWNPQKRVMILAIIGVYVTLN